MAVTNKKKLGKLFGGEIFSINYNFQPSTQPSTATVVVLNEDQVYQKPEFGSTVNLPPFGFPMDVVSIIETKEGFKNLQVELVEHSHRILDKELVLVYGLHTTHQSELNRDFYWTFKSYFVDETYWKSPRHPNLESPRYPTSQDRSSNGLNILGFARASIDNIKLTSVSDGSDFSPEAGTLSFDKGEFKEEASTALPSEWQFDENGPPSLRIQYGYYLKELRDLILKLGMRFEDGSDKYMEDEVVLFNDAGTLRDVLSSVLSKIGMTFYVNPVTQQIKIITNADIAKMNANLYSRFKNFDEQCAVQLTYSESIKDVEAEHVVVRGDLSQRDDEQQEGRTTNDPVKRKDKLYRIGARDITGLSQKELDYVYKFLPLTLIGASQETMRRYIYGTAIFEQSTDWGELYGQNELKINNKEYLKASWPYAADQDSKVFWNAFYNDEDALVYMNKKDSFTARNLYSGVEGQKPNDPVDPSSEYIGYIEAFAKMWGGLYISDAMTQDEMEERNYAQITRRGQNVTLIYASGDSFIGEHGELNFLVTLLNNAGRRTAVTVSELASAAGANTGVVNGDYHVIALQSISVGQEIQDLPSKIARYIGQNIEVVELDQASKVAGSNSNTFIVGTKEFPNMMKSLRRNFSRVLSETLKKRYDYILLPFFKTRGDKSVPEDDSENSFLDKGTPNFIRNIESESECFYKRSLNLLQMGVVEAENFIENFGTLNPTVPCPLISSSVSYDRAPTLADFDIKYGVNNVSISVTAEGGITTQITFSSRRFARIDRSIMRDYLGSTANNRSSIVDNKVDYRNAYTKNVS